ncbi:MAG: hypothetical protein IKD72_07410 [Clostridia bacterium]|nr:hypothetical protein [Clostridia bacterium]
MRIEISAKEKAGRSKRYYREFLVVSANYRRLIRQPSCRLRNPFREYLVLLIVGCLLLGLLGAVTGFADFDAPTVAALVLWGVIMLLCIFRLIRLFQLCAALAHDPKDAVLTLDAEGIELDRAGTQTMRLAWSGVAFVRVFRESICILPKERTSLLFAIDRKYEAQILNELKAQHPEILIIEQGAEMRTGGRIG